MRPTFPTCVAVCVLPLVLVLAACGAGGSGGTGNLTAASDAAVETYISLDLASGVFAAAGSDPVVTSDGRYRTTHVLLRRITADTVTLGCEGNLSFDEEKVLRQVSYREFFCAVYELTQEQWRRFAGTEPWAGAAFAGAYADQTRSVGATLPAWGMSSDQATAAAGTWSRDGWRIALPTHDQWEIACRAGTVNRLFPWGNTYTTMAIPRTFAVFAEPGATTVPYPAESKGQRQANAWGLHDFIGNVWEYALPVSGNQVEIRGGAFDQPLVACRASHAMAVPSDIGLPTVGVRLVLLRVGD